MDNEQAGKILDSVFDRVAEGIAPMESPQELAQKYMNKYSQLSVDEIALKLVTCEGRKNFTTGFLTGIGGILTLPLAISASLLSSWLIQARLVSAVAILYGHNIKDEKIRTLMKLALTGDAVKEILKGAGVKIVNSISAALLIKLPATVFIEINKRIGFQVLAKLTQRSASTFLKVVPVAGGLFSGGFDYYTTVKIGKTAVKIFSDQQNMIIDEEEAEENSAINC